MRELLRAQNRVVLYNFDPKLYPCPVLAKITVIVSKTEGSLPVIGAGEDKTIQSSPGQVICKEILGNMAIMTWERAEFRLLSWTSMFFRVGMFSKAREFLELPV